MTTDPQDPSRADHEHAAHQALLRETADRLGDTWRELMDRLK
ncbi:hypothetical protein [Kitasatospora kazusensis]